MTKARVNEIDLLRFLAALAVVFFHYTFRGYAADGLSLMPYPLLSSFSKYGYLGVELFFIISGFVILMTAKAGSLKAFLVSRFVRLYPAFWACCTITFLATLAIGAPHFSADFGQYVVNMTMLSGFVGVPSIDGAYWSLFIEMKFYLLVALVLVVGKIHRAELLLVLWLLATLIVEGLHLNQLAAFLIVDYAPYFIGGAAFFVIWSEGLTLRRGALVFASWCLALRQSLKALPELETYYHTVMDRTVVTITITAFFVVMLLVSLNLGGPLGRKRWVVAGALTYPLYLIHQNVGYMVFNSAYPAVNSHVLLLSTLTAVLAAAYAVHACVERKSSPLVKKMVNQLFSFLESLPLLPVRRSPLSPEVKECE